MHSHTLPKKPVRLPTKDRSVVASDGSRCEGEDRTSSGNGDRGDRRDLTDRSEDGRHGRDGKRNRSGKGRRSATRAEGRMRLMPPEIHPSRLRRAS
jgi:hypothetical protein